MKINIDIIKKIGRDKLILMIIAGVVLVLCTVWEQSGRDEENKAGDASSYERSAPADGYMDEYIKQQEKRLKEILKRIDGVGDVYVMITLKEGSGKNVLTDGNVSYEDTSEDDGTGGSRKIYTYSEDKKTVYVTDSSGRTEPYILSETAPQIEGVAVIAEGAESVKIKEKIINVIKALFGIEINKISVE